MLEDRCDYFILAYDSPNFSVAAAKVPMSPQGFAKALRNLERDLGVPLFVLGDDGVRRPTAYADELYEYARHQQAERNLLASAFERIAKSGYAEIRVASALGLPGLLGPNLVSDFKRKHADISLTVSELPDLSCDSVLRDGLYDLGLTILPGDDEFETVPLYTSPVLYWLRRDDPLASCETLRLEDLASRRLALPGREYKCYQSLLSAFERAGLAAPDIVECSELFWIYEFVHRGECLGFCLPHVAHLNVFTCCDDVITRPLEGFTWGFGISYLKGRSLSSRERDFVSFLEKRAASLRKRYAQ